MGAIASVVADVACGSSNASFTPSGDDTGRDAGPSSKDSGNASDTSTSDVAASDAPNDVDGAQIDAGPPDANPVCDPAAITPTASGALVLSTSDPDLMGGISDDELVIAWTSLTSAGPRVHWAERATTSDPFGPVQTLQPPLDAIAPDHVELRGDGLELAAASDDRTRMEAVKRTARGAAFDIDDTSAVFAGVNTTTEGTTTNPGYSPLGSPSLPSTFTTVWAFTQPGGAGLVVSFDSVGTWQTPHLPAGLVPPGSGAATMEPTGWSADGRTLFYWDGAANVERAAWRDVAGSDFTATKDVSTVTQYAVPNAGCGRLYYSAAGAGGDLDLFVAPTH